MLEQNLAMFVPGVCAGILFAGIVLFVFLALKTEYGAYRAVTLVAVLGFVFTTAEFVITLSGTSLSNFPLGAQFTRVQELAGTYFLPAIPFLTSTILPLGATHARVNRFLIYLALAISLVLTVISFAAPELFISLTERESSSPGRVSDYGRGTSGPLVTVRDMLLLPTILYLLVVMVVGMVRGGGGDRFALFLGAAAALVLSGSTVVHYSLGLNIAVVEWIPFSLVPVGITVFVVMAMAAVFTRFVAQSEELARANVRLEASRQTVLEVQDATVFALAYQAELRDTTTGHHLERTSKYVEILADQVRIDGSYATHVSADYVRDVSRAAYLHDVGKVGVPDSILLKPGKLEEDEFAVMKQHCELGARVLRVARERIGFASFYELAISIALGHHEKWDGSGYPYRLAGADISLSARMMAIADVYDALRSRRPYKEPMSHEKSLGIILKDTGTHFDPTLAGIMERCSKDFLDVSKTLGDD